MEQRFIYEYHLKHAFSNNPQLVYNIIKVDDLPKTYRRIGRATWSSSTRVWFKADEGHYVNGAVYFTKRDDEEALKEFVKDFKLKRDATAKMLSDAEQRVLNVSMITEAVEDEDY